MAAQPCEYSECYWIVPLKMMEMVNFTVFVFYHLNKSPRRKNRERGVGRRKAPDAVDPQKCWHRLLFIEQIEKNPEIWQPGRKRGAHRRLAGCPCIQSPQRVQ